MRIGCYEMLLDSERRALQRRQAEAGAASAAMAASEAQWQERYRALQQARKRARLE